MSESKHSDSEFYYPGELSDAEMLQLPTHNVVNWLLENARETKQFTPRACPRFTSGPPTQSISTYYLSNRPYSEWFGN